RQVGYRACSFANGNRDAEIYARDNHCGPNRGMQEPEDFQRYDEPRRHRRLVRCGWRVRFVWHPLPEAEAANYYRSSGTLASANVYDRNENAANRSERPKLSAAIGKGAP